VRPAPLIRLSTGRIHLEDEEEVVVRMATRTTGRAHTRRMTERPSLFTRLTAVVLANLLRVVRFVAGGGDRFTPNP
jgi:hypothetical protein